MPSGGPSSVGTQRASTDSAASPFEPVRSLTHTPEASQSAEVPKPETDDAAR